MEKFIPIILILMTKYNVASEKNIIGQLVDHFEFLIQISIEIKIYALNWASGQFTRSDKEIANK